MAKNKATVKIQGREFTVLSPDTPQHMERVAKCVDEKYKELSYSGLYLSKESLMTLTALNLADDLLKAQEEIEILKIALDWKKLQDP